MKSIASQMMRVQAEAQSSIMWKVDMMALQVKKALATLNSDLKAARMLVCTKA